MVLLATSLERRCSYRYLIVASCAELRVVWIGEESNRYAENQNILRNDILRNDIFKENAIR